MPRTKKPPTTPGALWIATMETESTSWMGMGATKEDAFAAIKRRWDLTQRNFALDHPGVMPPSDEFADWYDGTPMDEYYGVRYFELTPGEGVEEGDDELVTERARVRAAIEQRIAERMALRRQRLNEIHSHNTEG